MAENIYLSGTPWTEKEDDFLRLHYVQLSQRNIAVRLARKRTEIVTRMKKLDLKLTDEQRMLKKQAAGYKMVEYNEIEIFWDDEKKEYLRNHYSEFLNKDLAKHFGTTECAVTHIACKMGLKKSEAYLIRLNKEVIPRLRYSFRTKKEVKNVHGAICASL